MQNGCALTIGGTVLKYFSVTTQMKAIDQYFPEVLFIMLIYKVVLTFASVNEILECVIISKIAIEQ